MSLLPQRKKSPEELAKLRETLGIPGAAAEAPLSSATRRAAAPPRLTWKPSSRPFIEAAVVEDGDPLPLQTEPATPAGPKPVHSLKRSERMPAAAATPVLTATAAVQPRLRSPCARYGNPSTCRRPRRIPNHRRTPRFRTSATATARSRKSAAARCFP